MRENRRKDTREHGEGEGEEEERGGGRNRAGWRAGVKRRERARKREERERVPTGRLGSCNWKCNFDAEYTRKSPRKLKERLQPPGVTTSGLYFRGRGERRWLLVSSGWGGQGRGERRGRGGGEVARRPLGKVGFDLCRVALDARYISINCCIKYKIARFAVYTWMRAAPLFRRRGQEGSGTCKRRLIGLPTPQEEAAPFRESLSLPSGRR